MKDNEVANVKVTLVYCGASRIFRVPRQVWERFDMEVGRDYDLRITLSKEQKYL